MNQIPWEDASEDAKIGAIVDALVQEEVAIFDRTLADNYLKLKAQITDKVDLMRLDLEYHEYVRQLRQEGKVSSPATIREKAEKMVKYSPEEMRKALSEHYQETAARAAELKS